MKTIRLVLYVFLPLIYLIVSNMFVNITLFDPMELASKFLVEFIFLFCLFLLVMKNIQASDISYLNKLTFVLLLVYSILFIMFFWMPSPLTVQFNLFAFPTVFAFYLSHLVIDKLKAK